MIDTKNNKKRFKFSYHTYLYITFFTASILFLLVVTVSKTHADTLKFFFQNILLSENNTDTEGGSENVLTEYELHWSSFESEIPFDTEVTKISLHFLVTSDITNSYVSTEEFIASSTESYFSEVQSTLETDTTTTEPDLVEEVIESSENLPLDVSSTNTLSEVLPTSSNEIAEVAEEDTTEIAHQDEGVPILGIDLETVSVHESQDELLTETFQVESYTDETVPADVYISEVLPLEVITNETPASTTEEYEDLPLFEVLYSIDTITWHSLGRGDLLTTQHLMFDLTEVAIADISNVEIAILYIADEKTHGNIHFSQMRLEVECALPEEVVATVPDSLVDLEPNFEISSIQADVQSEDVRAVLLERGGMLELWYGVLQSATSEVLWQQLASDGTLGATTPLLIHERTIFWLDKNAQTLFGFSIDEQSLFGNSLMSDGESSLTLQFSSKNSVLWNVNYNPVSNTFEFKREK